MKKIVVLLLTVTMCLGVFVGCGGSGLGGSPKIDIDDIKYDVKETIVNGKRVPAFECTNNTKYDIAYIKLNYKVKDDVTEEELNANSTIQEKANSMEHALNETTVNVNTNKYIKSGESASKIRLMLDNTIEYLSDASVMEYMTPDILTVSYISGDNIYTAYYDYAKKEMSYDDDVKNTKDWPDSEIANLIPKPNSQIYNTRYDDDDYIWVAVLNCSKDDYDDYVEQCKEKGFNIDSDNLSYFDITEYKATNQDGVELNVKFDAAEDSLDITLDK